MYDNFPYFYGLATNNILFSKEKNSWLIVRDFTSALFANNTTKKPTNIVGSFKPIDNSNQMTIGQHYWNLEGDGCGKTIPLKFTGVRIHSYIISLDSSIKNVLRLILR